MFGITEGESLYAVLAILYLSECFIRTGNGAVIFSDDIFRGFGAGELNAPAGIKGVSVFPPPGSAFVSCVSAVYFSPTAVLAVDQTGISPGACLKYEELERISADGKEVKINGKRFCKFSFPAAASRFVLLAKKLKETPLAQRVELLNKERSFQFDRRKAEKLLGRYRKASKRLALFSSALFYAVFFLSPALTVLIGVDLTVIFAGAFMVLYAAFLSFLFRKVQRQFAFEEKAERVLETAKMILCPPLAVRTADRISLPLLSEFDSLVLAKLLLPEEGFEIFSGEYYRALKYPVLQESLSVEARAVTDWHNKQSLKLTEEFFTKQKIKVVKFTLAPPAEKNSAAYCPRCFAQYRDVKGECRDCRGILKVKY